MIDTIRKLEESRTSRHLSAGDVCATCERMADTEHGHEASFYRYLADRVKETYVDDDMVSFKQVLELAKEPWARHYERKLGGSVTDEVQDIWSMT